MGSTAKSALDIACWDIMGKALGKPVSELLGGQGRSVMSCSRSLPVDEPLKMARRAVELRGMGYEMITLKTGFDPAEDLQRVIEVRRAVGDDYTLEIDPNQAYRADQAIPLLRNRFAPAKA
jgi:L-alanine-DL-glutamate epimerase-like enolase superfamily enzyme